MKVILYTIGNSDISFYNADGNEISDKKSLIKSNFKSLTGEAVKKICFTEECKLVFRNPFEYNDEKFCSAEFKIFDAFYKAINDGIDCIYLFYTDQNHPQDTLYCAELLERYISDKYGKNCEKIKIDKDPSDYIKMDGFFSSFILKNKKTFESFEAIYFQITAGTPAMCINLALNLINYNTKMFCIKKVNNHSEAYSVKNSYSLHKKFINEQIKRELENLNYKMAKDIALNSFYRNDSENISMIEEGEKLLNFNYPELSEKEKIFIVLSRIEMSINCGKYIESLVLIVGLGEKIMINLLEDTAKRKNIKIDVRSSGLEDLVIDDDYLKNDILNNKSKKKYYSKRNCVDVLNNIMEHEKQKSKKTRIKNFLEVNKKLRKCADLRDNSPYAHGLEGIKEEDKETISDAFMGLKEYLNYPKNKFKEINDKISKKLWK